ncbi:MAG TPA: hypothetical protein VML55_08855 [Planctomycetaceae bacterium]|nr:hypothetical protein [Planctomycetaceae bacterium]
MRPPACRRRSCRRILFHTPLAVLPLVILAGPAAAEPQTVELRDESGGAWQIVIAPAEASALALQPALPEDAAAGPEVRDEAAEPADQPPRPLAEPRTIRTEEHGVEIVAEAPASSTYADLSRSIPFSRAEYDANPSYRHDATMELLTGSPRPPRCCPPATPYGPAAYPSPGYAPFDPYYGVPYRVFPYPAFGYKSRSYPVARHVYGVNYNLWYPTPGVFRRF